MCAENAGSKTSGKIWSRRCSRKEAPSAAVGAVASSDDPALATSSSDQQPSVLNFQLASRSAAARAPDVLAAVFLPARVGVWHAIGISDVVLIEADGVHALGKKAAAVGIDKPEHAVMLVNAKKAASAEAIIGDSTPFGSLQADTPTARITMTIYRIGRPGILDISQDRLASSAGLLDIALAFCPGGSMSCESRNSTRDQAGHSCRHRSCLP